MKSLKKQLVFTSALVSSFAFIALLIQIYSNALLYRHSNSLTDNQLPYTMALNELGEDLNATLVSLKNWVMFRDQESKKSRIGLWENNIESTLATLKEHVVNSGDVQQQIVFEEINTSMRRLHSSQWWVEDVSNYIGNQPALVLYQRDLLPIYSQIQSALHSIDNPLFVGGSSIDLQLLVSNTHVILSEIMHQLSQEIITGEVTHIKRFHEQAYFILKHLSGLSKAPNLDKDAKKSIIWILGQYHNYVNLVEKITEKRLASDWNIGLYLFNYETVPLTEAVLKSIQKLQQSQVEILQLDSQRTKDTALSALIASILLLFISAAWAIYYSMSHAQQLVDRINLLKMATRNVAKGKQMHMAACNTSDGKQTQLNGHFVNELDELAKTFNQMQITLFRQRKKFIRERERLSEIIHIISHDIKAPLINIKGHSKLINSDLEDLTAVAQEQPESIIDMQESLKHIMFSSDRISILIKRILQFSAVTQQEIKMLLVHPKQIIEDLIILNSARVKPEQFTFTDIPPEIISDAFSLQIIFSTLLDNSIKYQHPDRELEVNICYEKIPHLALHKFSIKDNGLGVLDVDIDKMFKLFVKSSTVNSGSGIGLANARSLAEKLNGDIEFYNNTNREGVTFVVSLHDYSQSA